MTRTVLTALFPENRSQVAESSWEGVGHSECCSVVSPASVDARAFLGVALPHDFGRALSDQASALQYRCWLVDNLTCLKTTCCKIQPSVAALFIDIDPNLKILACVKTCLRDTPIIAITDWPSLTRAAAAMRAGAYTVLARPTSFAQILAALDLNDAALAKPMSLDRAIWEYLNQVVLEARSIAGAARRLGLDRTSLKRMLRKRPPNW
jgi:ActR/RegA family two-component response regulator